MKSNIGFVIAVGFFCLSTLLILAPQVRGSPPPVGYWKFDEGSGSTAHDSSGNGNDGIIHTATWTEGRVGKALYFNGIDSWVQVMNNPTLSGFSQITLEAWIKPDRVSFPPGIISKCTGIAHPTYDAEYYLGFYNNDLAFHVSNYNYIAHDVVPGAIHTLGIWYHVAATWTGDSYTMYVDGIARISGSCTPSPTHSNTIDVQIGRHGSMHPGVWFQGIIDEVKIYNYARTSEEIWNDYSGGIAPLTASISPLSASMNVGNSITFTSTVSGGTSPYSYQWYLDGNPVLGATSSSWTFAPTTSGIYYVYLKVTDAVGNTTQSETARIAVESLPVGGYSFSIEGHTSATPLTPYLTLTAVIAIGFVVIRRKTAKDAK